MNNSYALNAQQNSNIYSGSNAQESTNLIDNSSLPPIQNSSAKPNSALKTEESELGECSKISKSWLDEKANQMLIDSCYIEVAGKYLDIDICNNKI